MNRVRLPVSGKNRPAIGALMVGALFVAGLPAMAAPLAMPMQSALATDRVAIKKVPPKYPPGAERRGITGSVLLEFTVDAQGNVMTPHVVQGNPPGVFDSVALQAITKWKYQVTGAETRGVQVNMKFELK